MENTGTITKNDLSPASKPRGKGGNTKVILYSIAGVLIFLAAFFLIEKQTNLIGLFESEAYQDLSDAELEEEEFSIEDLEFSEDEENKLKNTNDLVFSGLSDDQYALAVAFLEDELAELEPDSSYFVLDNTTLAYETAYYDTENATDGIKNVEVLSEEGLSYMESEDSDAGTPRGYSTINFDVVSSSRKTYKVIIDTGGTLSGFKEIKVSEQ